MSKRERLRPENVAASLRDCSLYHFLFLCVKNNWLDFSNDQPWLNQAEIKQIWQQLALSPKNHRPYQNLTLPDSENILSRARTTYHQAAHLLVKLVYINQLVVADVVRQNPASQITLETGLSFALNTAQAYSLSETYIKKYLYFLQQFLRASKQHLNSTQLLDIVLTATAAHELTHKIDSFLQQMGLSTQTIATRYGWLDYAEHYLPSTPANRRVIFHREHLARGVEILVLAHFFERLIPNKPAIATTAGRVFDHQNQRRQAAEILVDWLRQQGWSLTKIDHVLYDLIRIVENFAGYSPSDSPALMDVFAYGHPPYDRNQLITLLGKGNTIR